MESINLTVSFVNNLNSSGSLPMTGDFPFSVLFSLLFVMVMLILLFAKYNLHYSVFNKQKLSDASKIVSSAVVEKKNLILVFIGVFVSVVALLLCVAFTNVAHAEDDDTGLVPSSNNLTLTLNQDGTFTLSDCYILNNTNFKYEVDTTEIFLTEESSANTALKNSDIVLAGFNGILYDGKPDASQEPIDAQVLDKNEKTILKLDIKDINPLMLKELSNKPIFNINLYTKKALPEKCIAKMNFQGALIAKNVSLPEGWVLDDSTGFYIKEFPGGTPLKEVYSEWKEDNLIGISDIIWDDMSGIMDEDKVFAPKLEVLSTLNDYSWTDLKEIANDLSAKYDELSISTSFYYETFDFMANKGQAKSVVFNYSSGEVDKLYYRILGINHDTRSKDSKKAGLTFYPENCMNVAYTKSSLNWISSDIRDKLNPGGSKSDFYECLTSGIDPDKLGFIEQVKKKYAKGRESDDPGDDVPYSDEILLSDDYFWLLSITEINNLNYFNEYKPEQVTGYEGKQYEYIDKDAWFNLTKWHYNLSYKHPILCNYNYNGYEWIMNNYNDNVSLSDILNSINEADPDEEKFHPSSGLGWLDDYVLLRSTSHYYNCDLFLNTNEVSDYSEVDEFRDTMCCIAPICPAFCL